jgi:filamentous hemagglutinin family protein
MIKSTRLRTSLSASTILAAGLLLVVAPAQAQNLPDTGNVSSVTSGLSGGAPGSTDPGFSTSGTAGAQTLRVDLKDNRTILNWGGTGFNVAAGNTVDFKDARATAGVTGRTDNIAVLNRDLSGHGSAINGSITSDANIAVYVLNSNGILFGEGATVNTGGFLASTQNLTNDNDFLNGNSTLRFAGPDGSPISFGKNVVITTRGTGTGTGPKTGDLVLLSSQVSTVLTPSFGNFTLNASGDAAVVAAADVAIVTTPGSPLSMIVYRGSGGGPYGSMNISADITGRNVTVGNFGSGTQIVYGALTEFWGSITATGAAVTDRGVVLTNGAAPGVQLGAVPGTSPADAINAAGTIGFVGPLTSAKNLYIRGNNASVGGQFVVAGVADINLTGGYAGDGINNVMAPGTSLTAKSIDIHASSASFNDVVTTSGDFTYNGINSTYNGVELRAHNMTVAGNISGAMIGDFDAEGSVSASGLIKISTNGRIDADFGTVTAAGKIDLSADIIDIYQLQSTAGDILLRSRALFSRQLLASGKIDAQARTMDLGTVRGDSGVSLIADAVTGDNTAGTISFGSVTATNSNADLYLRAGKRLVGVSGVGDPGTLTAGRDATVVLNMNVALLTSVVAGRNATVNLSGSLGVGASGFASVEATNGFASVTSSIANGVNGNIVLGTLKGGAGASATGRSIYIVNGSGGTGSLNLSATGGNITIDAAGALAGRDVILSTDHAFVNNAGASAIAATNHWVIYSANPSGDTFGELDSGNTALWGSTLATRSPSTITGNRYVFSYQPTLIFASQDSSKVYGTDLTGSTALPFSVTGYQTGVSGAFQGDTAATAFSGLPSFTSLGFAVRASVAGGPYAISIGQGGLRSTAGYAFSFSNAGMLTVTPKALTANVVADNKTYDGTTASSGVVSLNGVISGDVVGTSGTTFTFADKNAGTAKTVNVSGTTLTGADAGNYTVTIPAGVLADILKKAITADVIANNKTYDGTTAATGNVILSGVVNGDKVGTSGTTFSFSDKNAGTGKAVAVAGTSLTGADAGNYNLTIPTSVLADILKKAITASVVANSKTYDGTTAGTGSVTLNGIVSGDAVGTTGTTFTFGDKNAGTGKTVTIAGTSLTGADAGNYTFTIPASALADILKKAITANVTANTKTYDGTTSGSGTVTLNGVVSGDSVGAAGTTFTFADKNAGTGKTVNVSGTTLTGVDAGNYTVIVPTSVLADILKKAITANVVANSKTYDGTTAGTGTVSLNGVVGGDTVGSNGTTFTFSDKNAGTGKTVTVAGTTLTGADAGNYTVTIPANALADILKKAITANVVANSKTYDGTTAGTGTVTLNGLVSGDTVTTGGTTFTYADKNAGTGKTVAVAGTTIGGADAGNYTITIPATALGDILKRALAVTADDASKVQNDPDPALTYTLTSGSLVTGDSFSGGLARDSGENPGTYAIKIGTLSAGGNYTINFTPGTFTINLPLGSEGLQPAFRAQPLPSQLDTGASSSSSVDLQTDAVCGDDKNCTAGKPGK